MKENIENYTVEELETLILEPYIKDKDFKRKILYRRQTLLNKRFDFVKNRKHIERINNILLRRMNEIYDKVQLVKTDLDKHIASGKDLYKDYSCTGKIYLEVNDDGLHICYAIHSIFADNLALSLQNLSLIHI